MAKPRRQQSATEKARKVFDQANDSVSGFISTFDTVREARGAKSGSTTDHEQDLLRAALVFSAAGLDSIVKELIRETFERLSTTDAAARDELEKFVAKQIRGDSVDQESTKGTKILAKILVSENPRSAIVAEYVQDITGSSLQSAAQLIKACKALGIQPNTVGVDEKTLRPIFDARNKIIHELDVNLTKTAARRNQNSRRKDEMAQWSRVLLEIGQSMINEVDAKI